jgi:hypothetical protein
MHPVCGIRSVNNYDLKDSTYLRKKISPKY